MGKIELLKALIEKETDPGRLDELNRELVAAIREEERVKVLQELEAEKKAIEQEKKSLEMKAKQASSAGFADGAKIEVGTGQYRGYSLKAVMDSALTHFARSPRLKNIVRIAKERPEGLERVAKAFVDIYETATKAPLVGKALAEGSGATGGYIVPTEERAELLAYIREASVAMEDCTHIPMASDSMTLPRELTKVTVAFTGEGASATEASPTFDQVTLTAKRMDAYTVSSNELLNDTQIPGGVVGMLMSQFIEAVGQKLDNVVFMGSTASGDPMDGVFNSAGYTYSLATGNTDFEDINEPALRGAIALVPSSRLANAKWYVHRSVLWSYIYGLKDDQGRPLFIPSLAQSAPDSLYGYPVRKPEEAPSTSAADTGFVVFGDLRGVWIGDRLTNISLFVDPYTESKKYQTVFLLFTRWGFAQALPGYYARIKTAAA